MTRQEVERMLKMLERIAESVERLSTHAAHIAVRFEDCIGETPLGTKYVRTERLSEDE